MFLPVHDTSAMAELEGLHHLVHVGLVRSKTAWETRRSVGGFAQSDGARVSRTHSRGKSDALMNKTPTRQEGRGATSRHARFLYRKT